VHGKSGLGGTSAWQLAANFTQPLVLALVCGLEFRRVAESASATSLALPLQTDFAMRPFFRSVGCVLLITAYSNTFGLTKCQTYAEEQEKKSSLAEKIQKRRLTQQPATASTPVTQEIGNPTYKRMLQSVVLIEHTVDDSACRGTGWIVDAENRLVVTNHHVIEGAETCEIFFPEFIDGRLNTDPLTSLDPSRAFKARVVDSDQTLDLALLQLERPLPQDALELELAEQSATPGQRIHSLAGSTVGSQSLWIYSTGHVRQIVRGLMANDFEAMLLESDMATNQGNSGGPVCDDDGKVVAVVEGHSTDARLVSIYIDLQSLVEYLDQALRCVDPKTVADLQLAANRHLSEGRPGIALNLATKATKLDAGSSELLTLRGWCRFDLEDDGSAEADFSEAVKIDPNFARAHDGLGHVAWQRGDLEEAKKHFTNAIRNDAEDPEYLVSRGNVQRQLELYVQARKDFEAALKIDPDYQDAIRGIAFTQIDQEQFEQGLATLESIVESYTKDAELFCYAGWALHNLGRYDEAVNALEASITLDPENAETHDIICQSLLELKRFADALPSATIARNAYPDDAQTTFRYGLALVGTGNIEQGVAAVKRAAQLDPDDQGIAESLKYLRKNL